MNLINSFLRFSILFFVSSFALSSMSLWAQAKNDTASKLADTSKSAAKVEKKLVIFVNPKIDGNIWLDKVLDVVSSTLLQREPSLICKNVLIDSNYAFSKATLLRSIKEIGKPALIITSSAAVSEAILSSTAELGYAPTLLTVSATRSGTKSLEKYPNSTGIMANLDYTKTTLLASALFPKAKQLVVLIFGTKNSNIMEEVKESLGDVPELAGKRIIYINADTLSSGELKSALLSYDINTPIVQVLSESATLLDKNNKNRIVASLVDSTKMPIFSQDGYPLQPGLVGGYVNLSTEYTEQIISLARKSLRYPNFADQSPFEVQSARPLIVYNEISDFNVSFENMPQGVILINPPVKWWQDYIAYAAFSILILILSVGLYLLYLYLKRREAAFKKVFEMEQNTVIMVDRKGRILFMRKPGDSTFFMKFRTDKVIADFLPEIQSIFKHVSGQVFLEKRSRVLHYEIADKFFEANINYIPSSEFGVECLTWAINDVTALQSAQRAESEMSNLLEISLMTAADWILTVDLDGTVTKCSESTAKYLSKTNEDIVGRKIWDVYQVENFRNKGDKSFPVLEAMRDNLRIDTSASAIITLDSGKIVRVSGSITPISDKSGKVTGALLIGRDISESYEKLSKLESANILMETTSNSAKIGYFVLNSEFKPTYYNLPSNFGVSVQDCITHPKKWMSDDDFARYKHGLDDLSKGKISKLEFRTESTKDSGSFYSITVVKNTSVEDEILYYGICQNITDIVASQKKYQSTFSMLTEIINNIPMDISLRNLDNDGRFVLVNSAFCTSVGKTKEEIEGKKILEIFTSAQSTALVNGDGEALSSNKLIISNEDFENSEGKLVHRKVAKIHISSTEYKSLILTIATDITDFWNLEHELKQKIKLLEAILENAPISIYAKNPDNDFRYELWNKLSDEMTLVPASEALGRTDFEIEAFPGSANSIRENDIEVLNSGKPYRGTLNFYLKNATPVVLDVWKNCVKLDDDKRMLVGIATNITELQLLEQKCKKLELESQSKSIHEKALNESLSLLIAGGDLDNLLNSVLQKIGMSTDADFCGLYKLLENHKTLSLNNVWKKNPAETMQSIGFTTIPNETFLAKLSEKRNVVVNDAHKAGYSKIRDIKLGEKDVESFAIFGIWIDNMLWGSVILAFYNKTAINPEDEKFLTVISHSIELAILRQKNLDYSFKNDEDKVLIFDSINVPIHYFNENGVLTDINKAALELAGNSKEFVLNDKSCRLLYGGLTKFDDMPVSKVMKTKEPCSQEVSIGDKTYLVSAMPIFSKSEELAGIVQYLADTTLITDAKKEIEKAKLAAESSNKAKNVFLATMSHEIRTPLNAIMGLSELLIMDPSTEKTEDPSIENVRSINTAGKALYTIINDVLELSKIEADKQNISYSWFNPHSVFAEVKNIFEPLASKKSLKLSFVLLEENTEIYFSESNLRQMLLNLLGNAVKFTDKGSIIIAYTLTPVKNDTSAIKIIVKDTGKGVHKDDFVRIFDPFEHMSDRKLSSGAEGAGLGLTIVSKIVQNLGGKISVSSELDVGTEFSIDFPEVMTRKSKGPHEAFAADISNVKGYKIWVVDDIEMNCKVLSMMLNKIGADCTYMTSPTEAIEKLKSGERPNLIMTDMWMPVMNGEEFATHIKRIDPSLPVIAVTADTDATKNFGMENFQNIIYKPVTIKKLDEVLLSDEKK